MQSDAVAASEEDPLMSLSNLQVTNRHAGRGRKRACAIHDPPPYPPCTHAGPHPPTHPPSHPPIHPPTHPPTDRPTLRIQYGRFPSASIIVTECLAGLVVALASIPSSIAFANIAGVNPLIGGWTNGLGALGRVDCGSWRGAAFLYRSSDF